jgi:prevent-host-death family protein
MSLSASKLRQDIYRILDRVLETGVPVEIERRGKILRIVPADTRDRLANLCTRDYLRVDPEELVHLDWSEEWRP